jgi:phage shock protein E
MAYTQKFQNKADAAQAKAGSITLEYVALDIRDNEEHDAGHIPGSFDIIRGKNADNRGVLSTEPLADIDCKNARFVAGGFATNRRLHKAFGTE